MRRKIILSVGAILFVGIVITSGQKNNGSHSITIAIPEVALLDLESSSTTSLNLSPTAPNEAGNAISFSDATNNDIWLNYSSVVGATEPTRKVTALVEGDIPGGIKVNVTASPYSGNGGGKTGISTGQVALSNSPQDIIAQIGSCYTGDGVNNGHKLTYSVELLNEAGSYANLNFDNSAYLSVTYTLTDVN